MLVHRLFKYFHTILYHNIIYGNLIYVVIKQSVLLIICLGSTYLIAHSIYYHTSHILLSIFKIYSSTSNYYAILIKSSLYEKYVGLSKLNEWMDDGDMTTNLKWIYIKHRVT